MAKWEKSKIIKVSSFLAVLLSAIVVFLCFVPTIEAKVAMKKHYDEKIAYFELENQKAPIPNVIFLGDGLVEKYDIAKSYPLVNKMYNRGIVGDDTVGLQKRLKVSLFDLQPKVCVLLIGSNNVKSAHKNYEEILAEIKERCKLTSVVVQSIYPTSLDYSKRNKKIVELNEKIKVLTEKYGFIYADVYSALKNENGELDAKYTTDGLHLNEEGYKKVTGVLSLALSPLL